MIRIATYNLWNSPQHWPQRLTASCGELRRLKADLLALQEVRAEVSATNPYDVASAIVAELGYPYMVFLPYPHDAEEGLALLSQHPIVATSLGPPADAELLPIGLRAVVDIGPTRLTLTNVHLTSSPQTIRRREREAVAVNAWVEQHVAPDCPEILLGDFNCPADSSVHRFLCGLQSLDGASAAWVDLAALYAQRTGQAARATLDIDTNPRWRDQPSLERPQRFDWILLRESYPAPPPTLAHVAVFGIDPLPGSGLVPSDHYGVMADIEFPPQVTTAHEV